MPEIALFPRCLFYSAIFCLFFFRFSSKGTIIKSLNQKGLRNTSGKLFGKSSLNRILNNEKYVGVYSYKGEVRIEGAFPQIVDEEIFAKVQEMLSVNKRKPKKDWNYADYILTDKLFCGRCGSPMAGESGTSRSGVVHNYYVCTKKRRERACDKKAVRQGWIEGLVMDRVRMILDDDELLNFIADCTYKYYIDQNNNTEFEDALRRKLRDVETATKNLIRAIETGILNESTKQRMDELDIQRAEINTELADLNLAHSIRLTRDHIIFFLLEFRKLNTDDINCQKRLVETFVNAVFVYDDEVTLTFRPRGRCLFWLT